MEPQQNGGRKPKVPHIEDIDALYGLLKSIPLTTAGKRIEALLGEITNLQAQVKSKDDEVTRLTNESHKMQADRNASFEVLLDANHRAKKNCTTAEQQVEDLNKRIHDLEASLTDERKSKSTLEKQYKDLDTAFTQEKHKVAQGRDECKKKEKILEEKESMIEKLKTAGSEVKQRLTETKKHNKTLEGALEALRSKMAEKDSKLDKLESFRTPYQEINEEEMCIKYDGIWDLAVNEISQHLEVDRNLTVHQARPKLLTLTSTYNIPLPFSNSNAAKQMRLIGILALLAREIDKQIFQPAFFISAESGIRERCLKLATTDKERESYCRSILLSVGTDSLASDLNERIKNVTKYVSSCVDDIFTDEQCSKISLSVKTVTQRAAEVWQTFQRTKAKYEAVFEISQSGSEECVAFDFLTNEPERGEEANGLPTTTPLVIFPRLSRYEDGAIWTCCEAVGVRRSMPEFREAEKEQIEAEPQSPVHRIATARERRTSLAQRRSKTPGGPNGSFLGSGITVGQK